MTGLFFGLRSPMAQLFSIGEMSKIHNISIKTLRYYDTIGLFRPVEVNHDNGYRYYSYKQFEQLNTIKYLKYLGVALKDIGGYMSVHDKDDYLVLLEKEQNIINGKLRVLQNMKVLLQRQMEEVEGSKQVKNLGEIFLKEIPKRQVIRFETEIRSNYDLELSLHQLKSIAYKDQPIVIGLVGLAVSRSLLEKRVFDHYDSIFILADDVPSEALKWVLPEALYACVYYNDHDHSESPMYLRMLMDHIEHQGYEVIGDAVERVIINDYKTNNPKDYLTELQIPIKKP